MTGAGKCCSSYRPGKISRDLPTGKAGSDFADCYSCCFTVVAADAGITDGVQALLGSAGGNLLDIGGPRHDQPRSGFSDWARVGYSKWQPDGPTRPEFGSDGISGATISSPLAFFPSLAASVKRIGLAGQRSHRHDLDHCPAR